MKAAGYYIVFALLYLISKLPFWCLYLLSDALYVLIYKLIGYRREVVMTNLRNSFPEKTEDELLSIEKKFYHYFFDLIVETVKTLSISPKALQKRLTFKDTAIFEKYSKKNQSIIIVMGHYGNWELGGARFALETYHKLIVVYHPLKNKQFDKLIYHMRTRLGNGLYAMNNTLRGMLSDRSNLTATAFIADQTPSPKGAFWMDFLKQDTPFFVGTGKIATKLNYPVVYVTVQRTKRGYYTITIEDLCESPKDSTPEEIVQAFSKRLEQDIIESPETWLWSHRRWKHKRETVG